MSTKCLTWAIDRTTGSATRKIVLLLLADLADEQYTCYPGREYLAERAELSPGVVSKVITQLAADGLVRVLRRAKRAGGRRSNRYLLLINGEQTALPDVDDWVSEFAPAVDETPGESNGAAETPMPDGPDETPGQGNGAAETPMPDGGNGAAATHSNVRDEHSSKREEIYPLGTTQNPYTPPPSTPHPAGDLASAAADVEALERARSVLRRVTVGVDVLRMPTGPERGRLVERVLDAFAAGWHVDQLADRLNGMGTLVTVASVYAVLHSRLGQLGDPPAVAAPTSPAAPVAAAWCRSEHCDRTTRRKLDDDGRPVFALVDGDRRKVWCPTCSGR